MVLLCLLYFACGTTEGALDLDLLGQGLGVKVLTATVIVAEDKLPIWLQGIDSRVYPVATGVWE